MSGGIGYGNQVQVADQKDEKLFVLTFVVCGVVAASVLAVLAVYLVRRRRRSLKELGQPGCGTHHGCATQDYQDLCRQHMSGKTKPDPIYTAAGKQQGGENVKSPSSRSSTSSWSEEPVLSNMDISTGHAILAYMEGHLKDQDRLQSEWSALQSYEAEPNCTNAANNPANKGKNRYPGLLPYDHSRVVLREATNISGSDYINASLITDHDPRSPAYVVAQGPRPETLADWWQMIWEQGSLVIVMLTRCEEDGLEMSARYWPDEGSQLYHIYEVHLVSEHIWCDDYIVRSFYLKNLQTNETRTVTQFHFMSWPHSSNPANIKALLEFRRKVNKSFRGRSCPVTIHCNDGCGRSGTYCLIDMVLNRMVKGAKEIDLAATLEHLRDQRMNLVTTKDQFEFALTVIAEEVHAILRALAQ